MPQAVPYLLGVRIVGERVPAEPVYPFDVACLRSLDLSFRHPVTFFVGENGSGKSTLIEALAVLCRFPVSGGSRAEAPSTHGPEQDSPFAGALRPSFRKRPRDGYFFRAVFQAHFASLLDARKQDPDFASAGVRMDPYLLYGGKSLHRQSHGEAFLAVLQNRLESGMFLLDEPEAALSPQRQLALLALIHDLVSEGSAQFIIATHSPILMSYPGAQIVNFDQAPLRSISFEETSHYQITRGILEHPERYWKHLTE
jgi:predicted ATPase